MVAMPAAACFRAMAVGAVEMALELRPTKRKPLSLNEEIEIPTTELLITRFEVVKEEFGACLGMLAISRMTL